jgi:hypothetical protein
MTPHDRLRISLAAARYLEALEGGDETTLTELWELAANDPEMIAAFQDVHAGLHEDDEAAAKAVVADAAERHLRSSEVIQPVTGTVTVGDVARELFRHPPSGLSGDAHQLNEKLRLQQDELPENLGLTRLVQWAEAKFGPAPLEYWKAFREAAITLDLRRGAEVEYQLAARAAPRPGDRK